MSNEEPIYCFNGKECCYNIETICIFYQGTKENGCCILEPMKGGTPTPVAQTNPLTPQTTKTVIEKGKYVEVTGVIIDNPSMAKGERKDGNEWKRTNFTVNVDNKEYRVTLWDELAVAGMEYKAGQFIKFKGIYVDDYKGTLQFVSKKYTEILE